MVYPREGVHYGSARRRARLQVRRRPVCCSLQVTTSNCFLYVRFNRICEPSQLLYADSGVITHPDY
jgi:hypothetical protein